MIHDINVSLEYFYSGSKTVIIDTNLLLLLLIGSEDKKHISKFKRTQDFNERDYNALLNILGNFKKFVVTPHILTEISNLAGKNKFYKKNIFKKCIEVMSSNEFEEEFIESQQMFSDDVCYCFYKLGITDAAIIKHAKNKDYKVITIDKDLHSELKKLGIISFNFYPLIEKNWK